MGSTNSAAAQASLSGQYNSVGITASGMSFSGGLDGQGNALPAAVLGTPQTWNGATFNIAPAGSDNVVRASGQTIALPSGSYSQVELLATGVNGNQPSQTFTVNYTDGTSQTFTQSISDWHCRRAIRVRRSHCRAHIAILPTVAQTTMARLTCTVTRFPSTTARRSAALRCPTTRTWPFWRSPGSPDRRLRVAGSAKALGLPAMCKLSVTDVSRPTFAGTVGRSAHQCANLHAWRGEGSGQRKADGGIEDRRIGSQILAGRDLTGERRDGNPQTGRVCASWRSDPKGRR